MIPLCDLVPQSATVGMNHNPFFSNNPSIRLMFV